MSAHLALSEPVAATRSAALGATGLQARRVLKQRSVRSEIRALLLHSGGRHRVTFIPLDRFSMQSD